MLSIEVSLTREEFNELQKFLIKADHKNVSVCLSLEQVTSFGETIRQDTLKVRIRADGHFLFAHETFWGQLQKLLGIVEAPTVDQYGQQICANCGHVRISDDDGGKCPSCNQQWPKVQSKRLI